MGTATKAKKAPKKTQAMVTMPPDFWPFDVNAEGGIDDLVEEMRSEVLLNTTILADDAIAFVTALDPEQRAQLVAWVRAYKFVTKGPTSIVSASDLAVPAFLEPVVHPECSSIDAMLGAEIVDPAQIAPAAPDLVVMDETAQIDSDDAAAADHAEFEEELLVDEAGQGLLLEETEPPAKVVAALDFHGSDQVLATAQALKGRASDLLSLAKKNKDLGKLREARSVELEAKMIEELLLPQLQSQTAIPFDVHESLPAALTSVIGHTARTAFVRAFMSTINQHDGESYDDARARRQAKLDEYEEIIGPIAAHAGAAAVQVVLEAADRGWQAGLNERKATPEFIAREAAQAVRARQLA